jgi:Tfp pilus assembly protein PilF
MMNPKDIPFAAGYIGSIFFMFRIFKSLPKFSRWDIAVLLVALGFSLSVRVGAVLIFIYFIAFFCSYILAKNWANKGKEYPLAKIWPAFVTPILGGFVLGVLFWPYGLLSPIAHTVESLTTFTEFPISVNVLFRGNMIWSSDIPFEYLFVWIGSTIPISFLLGILLFLICSVYIFKKGPTFLVLCNIFVVLFPLFYVVYKDSPLYDGWRHFNFIYVAAVPLIALAWDVFGQWMNRQWKGQYLAYSLFFLLSLEPAYHIATNFSIPYVYFNPIVGGTAGAFGEFEMDYWGISTKNAVEAMEDRGILHKDMDEEIVLGVNFSYGVRHWLDPEYADHVKLKYTRYRERYNSDWDYAIFVGRFMDGAHMKAIDWPGSVRVVESIKVNDEPVCAIFARGEEFAFNGIQAFRAGKNELAKELLQKEINYDPKNELAYFTLGEVYFQEGQYKKAISYFEESLQLNPHSQQLIMRLAVTYLNEGQVDKAERLLQENVQRNRKDYASYYYLALIHAQTQRLNTAADYIEKSIDANPNFREAYGLGAQIYKGLGDNSKASYYETLSKQ